MDEFGFSARSVGCGSRGEKYILYYTRDFSN
jgi:hypothetical protein